MTQIHKKFNVEKKNFQFSTMADGYRKISLGGHSLPVPGIESRDDVDLHLVHGETKNLVEIRMQASGHLMQIIHLPIAALPKTVHF